MYVYRYLPESRRLQFAANGRILADIVQPLERIADIVVGRPMEEYAAAIRAAVLNPLQWQIVETREYLLLNALAAL